MSLCRRTALPAERGSEWFHLWITLLLVTFIELIYAYSHESKGKLKKI